MKSFRIIRHLGIGTAVCVGASLSKHDTLITMDADFPHPRDLIPALVEKTRETDLSSVIDIQRRGR